MSVADMRFLPAGASQHAPVRSIGQFARRMTGGRGYLLRRNDVSAPTRLGKTAAVAAHEAKFATPVLGWRGWSQLGLQYVCGAPFQHHCSFAGDDA